MVHTSQTSSVTLPAHENQARAIAQYALDMLGGQYAGPSDAVLDKVEQFHLDSVACGVSAIALGANAPHVLRREAFRYPAADGSGVPVFGSTAKVQPEKAVLACASAVREWDANGTNFGYNPSRGAAAGEFGHNDFYSVAVAGAQLANCDGRHTLVAMTVIDEIRGRLAEAFALKNHKIDHVVHGAIASAAVYGALLGATVDQIESAIGLLVAHYVPFRAIRSGHQLSDSKGASAALTTEMAVTSVRRSMDGFVGPADILRNAQAIFCLYEKAKHPNCSPFDLTLATAGDDFAVMGMHFKLGLYEHQSAGAIQGLFDLIESRPTLLDRPEHLLQIKISIYEPAFGIIGDPAKRDPRTRQSADHSMVYIVATLLRKAYEARRRGWNGTNAWQVLMLEPRDYDPSESALFHKLTRRLMDQIDFQHGGEEMDRLYPDGIPTIVGIGHVLEGSLDSGLVMYPTGHARADNHQLPQLLRHKCRLLVEPAVADVDSFIERFSGLKVRDAQYIAELYDFEINNQS